MKLKDALKPLCNSRTCLAGSACLSIVFGTALAASTPDAMLPGPADTWREAAMMARFAANSDAYRQGDAVMSYSSVPEDLSPLKGYGNPTFYRDYYVEAPQKVAYATTPDYLAPPPAPAAEAVFTVPVEPAQAESPVTQGAEAVQIGAAQSDQAAAPAPEIAVLAAQ